MCNFGFSIGKNGVYTSIMLTDITNCHRNRTVPLRYSFRVRHVPSDRATLWRLPTGRQTGEGTLIKIFMFIAVPIDVYVAVIFVCAQRCGSKRTRRIRRSRFAVCHAKKARPSSTQRARSVAGTVSTARNIRQDFMYTNFINARINKYNFIQWDGYRHPATFSRSHDQCTYLFQIVLYPNNVVSHLILSSGHYLTTTMASR